MITIEHGLNYTRVWTHASKLKPIGFTRSYLLGKEQPNYPMPATIDNAETATNWTMLSYCPHYNGPCKVCISKWEDQMLYDFPILD